MITMSQISSFISDHFLSPWFFAALGLIPVVVLLYLLKLRRTRIVIPSIMLWTKSIEDLTANAPFRRLRKNLLLFLQVLILLLVVAALARPYIQEEGTSGKNLCLMIDRSASMSVVETGKTRLQKAKDAALEIVAGMGPEEKAMVVTFGAKSDVLCELTDDRGRLRDTIEGIRPSDTRTNIRDALLLARSLSPDNPDVPAVVSDLEVILLSDGKVSDLEELGLPAAGMQYLRIGETSGNAGIVAFSVRTTPPETGSKTQAFVLVHNEADAPLSTTITLYHDDRLLGVHEVEAPPGADREAVFDVPHQEGGILRAELDHEDALSTDNVARLALQPRARINVLLVAEDDSGAGYFLKHALALDPRVDLATIDPGNYAKTGEYDLTIFDAWSPKQIPPGCLAYINTIPPIPGLQVEGKVKNPPVLAVESTHTLTRFLNPTAVLINEALKLKLPEGARPLISTTGGPLVADISRGGRRIVVVAFDPAASNWPLNLSFPLFVQNLVAWASDLSPSGITSVSAGDPLTIMPWPHVDHATVTLPDGTTRRVEMDPLRPVFFAETGMTGIYTVERGDESIRYAVNLLDKTESSVTPEPSLRIGRGEVAGETGTIKRNREFWRWLLLVAIAVLTLEWWIYSRRAWI